MTSYHWHPGLTPEAMHAQISALYGERAGEEPCALALAILDVAATRLTRGVLRYVEVSEASNPRRSFDLNLYDAGLRMHELEPLLQRMARYFALPGSSFEVLLATHRAKLVGHLAGGAHRAGEDFFNIYFGLEERHGPIEDLD